MKMKTKLFITDPKKDIVNKYYNVKYIALNKKGEDILNRAKKEADISNIIEKEKISFQSVLKWVLVEKFEGARKQSFKENTNEIQ